MKTPPKLSAAEVVTLKCLILARCAELVKQNSQLTHISNSMTRLLRVTNTSELARLESLKKKLDAIMEVA